jgi:tetratricopeptide (TPR) repeat protein
MPRCAVSAPPALAVLGLLAVLGGVPASADEPGEARRLIELGQVDAARERLRAWIESTEPSGPPALEAARLAAELKDGLLLEDLQGRLEGKPGTKEPGPTALALATAWLGLAESRLGQPGGGSGVAFLFADAEKKARDCLAGPPEVAAEALRVLARVKHAQGDLAGALAVLAERSDLAGDAAVAALEGRLRYERALTTGLGADGRPTAAGTEDLTRAAARLKAALAVEGGLPVLETRRARLLSAYTLHRVGDLDGARAAYLAAHAADPTSDKALRGLKSLLANDDAAYRKALEELPRDRLVSRARVEAALAAKDVVGALAAAEARLADDPAAVDGWLLAGSALIAAQRWDDAVARFRHVHSLAPNDRTPITGLERTATAAMDVDVERGIAIYEQALGLLPDDPYVRNNFGFVLREVVTPHTEVDQATGLQRFRPDAPHRTRAWLDRCVAAYAEAVARIPEAKDKDLDEATAWNLAGIVNDYGLVVHYFVDVQDLPKAEALYLRALRMTRDTFKDTYAPNLQRLYRLMPDREWAWYRAARRCRDAILKETGVGPDGNPALAPDEEKRAAAARDVEDLRARLVRTLQDDAREDGVDLSPPGKGGTGK